ncbi:hypothetical protein VP01_2978g1 [Puccinia sorghi]|uniref:Uncharacterized protein n=1 Tax=Puccinia sorghi TaxID=27349 RepID=A0A0L6V0P5_9BASI|nr:hypothetical protein VP01_2978g1 [Puccinia sorghi]
MIKRCWARIQVFLGCVTPLGVTTVHGRVLLGLNEALDRQCFKKMINITHISYAHHFMTLIVLFYVMITMRIWIKALLVSLHHFFNPTSTHSITPDNPNHGSQTKPTLLSQTLKICSEAWISTNLMVQFMILLHRAWKANQISSASQSSLFPPRKMSHSCCYSALSLSSNLLRLLHTIWSQDLQPSAQQSVQNNKMLYIIKLISPLGYSSKHYDCIVVRCFLYLGGGYKRVVVELRSISTEIKTYKTRIGCLLNLFKDESKYNKQAKKRKGVFSLSTLRDWSSRMITGLHWINQQQAAWYNIPAKMRTIEPAYILILWNFLGSSIFSQVPSFSLVSLAWLCCVVSATRAVYMLACKCFHINFLNNLLVASGICYHPSTMNKSDVCFVKMIITHISYSHHFMTFIFFFYVMIASRIWIKALLGSLHQFLNSKSIGSITPGNPNHGSLTKSTQLSQPIKTC